MFGKKNKKVEAKLEKKESESIVTKETSLVDPSYNIKKLYYIHGEDLYLSSNINNKYYDDITFNGLHPTDEGHYRMSLYHSKFLANILNNNNNSTTTTINNNIINNKLIYFNNKNITSTTTTNIYNENFRRYK